MRLAEPQFLGTPPPQLCLVWLPSHDDVLEDGVVHLHVFFFFQMRFFKENTTGPWPLRKKLVMLQIHGEVL